MPQHSQLRPEFGEIEDIGEPMNEQEARTAQTLWELKKEGRKIAVSFASGVSYWRDEFTQAGLHTGEWGWLRDLKSYRITELAAYLVE